MSTVQEGYALCEQVTRTRARNFHYGIRLLPGPKRRALCWGSATSARSTATTW